jgi:hypothetical protein
MRCYAAAIGLSVALISCSLAYAVQGDGNAATIQSVAQDSGLVTWETPNRGVHLRLTQISPDQARAFMQGRGLDQESIEEFAHTCVYMTVLRNDSNQPIRYSLADWRFLPVGKSARPMLTKQEWLSRWQTRKLAKQVKLAFEWSQFPLEQTFSPGDWNQGMTTFDLPGNSRFDVLYRWRQDGKVYDGVLKDVRCPARAD